MTKRAETGKEGQKLTQSTKPKSWRVDKAEGAKVEGQGAEG